MLKKSLAVVVALSLVAVAARLQSADGRQQDDRPAFAKKAQQPKGFPPGDGPGGFGPPGGPGGAGGFGPPGGFSIGGIHGPQLVEAADADGDGKVSPQEAAKAAARFVKEADADKKGSIDARGLARAINKSFGPPADFAPPGGGDFGPGMFVGPQIFEAADADADGKLTPDEASKAAEKFVRDAGAGDRGAVDGQALAQAIDRRVRMPGFGPGGPGGPGGPPGMGGDRKLVKQFDKDGNGRLETAERKAARAFLKKEKEQGGGRGGFMMGGPGGPGGRGPGGPGGPGGRGPGGPGGFPPFGGQSEKGTPGPKIAKKDVKPVVGKSLYDPTVLRTIFLDFPSKDWESEMADFYSTDVEVPAILTVDGKSYPDVGVHFRGMSSYFTVGAGSKRSLNVSLDYVNPDQKIDGYKTLNLLNAHEDPTFLHTVLYFDVARRHIPAPKANFVKVVVNGESWGIYTNVQQFDKKFLAENFPEGKGDGARWKVRGNPMAAAGLDYLGEDVEAYKRKYEIKTKDNAKDWAALVNLCKVLSRTPADKLEAAIKPILDVDGVLWFLALENALINSDGYWIRASDYTIHRDPKGVFHVVPHDANETFQPAMGPGMGGPGGPGGRGGNRGPGGFGPPGGGPGGFGPGGGPPGGGPGGFGGRQGGPGGGPGMFGPGGGPRGGGLEIDPLIGLDDERKPLRSKLLAVPAFRRKYLENVRTIAVEVLDWNKLEPKVEAYANLIDAEIKADTRKLTSYQSFRRAIGLDGADAGADVGRGRPGMDLRSFAEQRSKYLLNHPEIKKLP